MDVVKDEEDGMEKCENGCWIGCLVTALEYVFRRQDALTRMRITHQDGYIFMLCMYLLTYLVVVYGNTTTYQEYSLNFQSGSWTTVKIKSEVSLDRRWIVRPYRSWGNAWCLDERAELS